MSKAKTKTDKDLFNAALEKQKQKQTEDELYDEVMDEAFKDVNLRADFVLIEPFKLTSDKTPSGIHLGSDVKDKSIPHQLAKIAKLGSGVNKYLWGTEIVDMPEEECLDVGDWALFLPDPVPRPLPFGNKTYYVADARMIVGVLKKDVLEKLNLSEKYLMSPAQFRGVIEKFNKAKKQKEAEEKASKQAKTPRNLILPGRL
jgi:hypothetical protein